MCGKIYVRIFTYMHICTHIIYIVYIWLKVGKQVQEYWVLVLGSPASTITSDSQSISRTLSGNNGIIFLVLILYCVQNVNEKLKIIRIFVFIRSCIQILIFQITNWPHNICFISKISDKSNEYLKFSFSRRFYWKINL